MNEYCFLKCAENLNQQQKWHTHKKGHLLFPGITLLSHNINNLSQVFAESFMLLQHRKRFLGRDCSPQEKNESHSRLARSWGFCVLSMAACGFPGQELHTLDDFQQHFLLPVPGVEHLLVKVWPSLTTSKTRHSNEIPLPIYFFFNLNLFLRSI